MARSPPAAKVFVKNDRFGPKVILCVWWNFEVVVHWEFVPNGHAVDAELYSQQLERVHEILRRRCPALVNRIWVLLQQDNARPHTARTTMTKIEELGGIDLPQHPAYSHDLAPSDIICFNPWSISCVEEISKTLKLWKLVSPNSLHQKPETGIVTG